MAIVHRFALGTPWTTFDPFLFCVHHDDRYPAGNGRLAPSVPTTGRSIGNDFSGRDGWSMYHGTTVPGFPQHPHRGFETVTFVRRGLIDHSDSLGAAARYGAGDVQWLTAGAGIVHAEMFPLLRDDAPNHAELFQIWLNLPAADKMSEPRFSMLWAEDIPVVRRADAEGREVEITVVAGALEGAEPPAAPPASWASRPGSDVAIWRLAFDDGAAWTMPAAPEGVLRTLYVFEGGELHLDGPDSPNGPDGPDGPDGIVPLGTGAVLDPSAPCPVRAVASAPGGTVTVLVLQGRPIGEPVAQYGPFVMNDRAGIVRAYEDYQRTGFGGWPWPVDDPTHGHEPVRFARHRDGRVERPPAALPGRISS